MITTDHDKQTNRQTDRNAETPPPLAYPTRLRRRKNQNRRCFLPPSRRRRRSFSSEELSRVEGVGLAAAALGGAEAEVALLGEALDVLLGAGVVAARLAAPQVRPHLVRAHELLVLVDHRPPERALQDDDWWATAVSMGWRTRGGAGGVHLLGVMTNRGPISTRLISSSLLPPPLPFVLGRSSMSWSSPSTASFFAAAAADDDDDGSDSLIW